MKAKEYLNRAYKIDHRINSKLAQIAELKMLATKATATIGMTPPSGTLNPHRTQDIVAKIVDLEREINCDINSLLDIKREVMDAIRQVADIDCQLVLEKRYLCYCTWEQIAVDLDCSVRRTHIVHGKALDELDKILGES